MVDDDKYYELIKYIWYVLNSYVILKINGKYVCMYIFLMKNVDNIIDYINNNKLDNRLFNLCISNYFNNCYNKNKK